MCLTSRAKRATWTGISLLVFLSAAYSGSVAADPPNKSVILFVCEHGSAKSVVAAAHFNRLAEKEGLPFVAIARGVHPDSDLAEPAVNGMRGDGLAIPAEKPGKVTQAEASGALRVISFCDLPKEIGTANVERWDVPPISEDYAKSRDAILKNVQNLITQLKKSP